MLEQMEKEREVRLMRAKRIAAVIVCIWIMLCAAPAQAVSYSDIQGHEAQESIELAAERGWFADITGDTFQPDAPLTRALLASVLARYDGASLSQTLTVTCSDVSSDSRYAGAVSWAVENEIIPMTSGTAFSPDQEVTREELAVILIQYVNYKGTVLPRTRSGLLFDDADDCSDDTLDALYTLYRAGVMEISEDEQILPTQTVTRAACAEILCSLYDACADTCTADEQAAVISHMGYSYTAPENTLEAFETAKEKQYSYVETDVRFTADDVPVLLHDATIDRTSDGSGRVAEMTYSELQAFDFSAGKAGYSRVQLTTFRSFISLCAQCYLHPFIELKQSLSSRQLQQMYEIVEEYGMSAHVTWISFDYTNLTRMQSLNPKAELGLLSSSVSKTTIKKVKQLKNGQNRVYLCARYTKVTAAVRSKCLRAGVYLEVWTIDDRQTAVEHLNSSAQGVTVDKITVEDLYGS